MKDMILALAILALAGCSTAGPGQECDTCATAEVSPSAPFGQAAASAASGGQDASQQPYNRDTARLNPFTTVGRGSGATTSQADTREVRELASGGATNISFVPSVSANASTGGGSIPPVVLELRETVQDLRARARQAQAMGDTAEVSRLDRLIQDTLASLMTATANTAQTTTINYNWQNSRNQMTGVSSSKTGRQDGDPETVKSLAAAAAESTKTLFSGDYEDSSFPPPAPQKVEAPTDAPPAGVSPSPVEVK